MTDQGLSGDMTTMCVREHYTAKELKLLVSSLTDCYYVSFQDTGMYIGPGEGGGENENRELKQDNKV